MANDPNANPGPVPAATAGTTAAAAKPAIFKAEDLAELVAAAQGALAEDRKLKDYLTSTLSDDAQVAAFMRVLETHRFEPSDPAYLLLEHHKLMDEAIRRAVGYILQMLESQMNVTVNLTRVMQGYAELGAESLTRVSAVKEWLEQHHAALKNVLEAVARVSQPGGMSRGTVCGLVFGGAAIAGLVTGGVLWFAAHARGLL